MFSVFAGLVFIDSDGCLICVKKIVQFLICM